MIPLELLELTDSAAPRFTVYGGAGLKKTHEGHELPPPVLVYDIGEDGTASLLPWIRRKRQSNGPWIEYSQEHREKVFSLVQEEARANVKVKPAPLVDIIHYNNTRPEAYDEFVSDVGSLDIDFYSSVQFDSLQEWAVLTQTFTKKTRQDLLMTEIPFSWSQAQERAQMVLRKMKNLSSQGIVVYCVGSEDISKDYVKSPFEKKKGETAAEAYSIRGTVDAPGKLASSLGHAPDVLMHARLMNGQPGWVTAPEALPGGEAHWDAKDRYGRLDRYVKPSFRDIFRKLYGDEIAGRIYATGRAKLSI